ncbi:hypothetical protein KsCSTR_12050 [Candidatus Kuenenia stuttgartiensis]|nr:hypothetical protein KsCSTR_12050 [Candidatus Kuenenia stuttgartiensis]
MVMETTFVGSGCKPEPAGVVSTLRQFGKLLSFSIYTVKQSFFSISNIDSFFPLSIPSNGGIENISILLFTRWTF